MDNGRLFYVVAYEVDQYIKDITPRYAKSYAGRTLKMRIQNRKKDDPDWFDEAIQPWTRPFSLGREQKEDEQLARYQEAEPMPTVLEGFKNHPQYVLERHLKREEVLIPKTKQLGLFRGEPVFPRSAVVGVKSSENWMREGRTIRDGEQPLKNVKQRAVTINRRRAQEMAMQEGQEPLMQGLYSRNQTELVIPPPIKDGKVPKNSYGNLDLFAPHMLPKGAVHLPHKNIRKVAKELGIDFAEAITGFEFHKRRAVPVVSGIVAAEEHRDMLLEAYYAQETVAVEKEMAKRRERALKKWKKLIVGLRVRSRIQGEYRKNENASTSPEKGKSKAELEEGKSQFQLAAEEEEELRKQSQIADIPDPSATSGGFITNGVHPEVPGGALFPPLHPHPPAPLDDGQQLDLTMLDLPPMPIPDPAAVDYESPIPDFAQQAFNAEFDYPPQSELNDMAIDVSRISPEAIQRMEQADKHSSRSSSSASHHSEHVDLDEFTLRDPEEIAKGAPEIGDEDEPLQGGFIRDDEEDVEKPVVAPGDDPAARKKHRAPPSEVSPRDDKGERDVDMDPVNDDDSEKPVQNGRATRNGLKVKLPIRSSKSTDVESDEGEAEVAEEDEHFDEADYREPTPPATTRSTRSTRALNGKGTSNGTVAASSPSSGPAMRRSTRTSAAHATTESKPAARATRGSRRTAKKEETDEDEDEDDNTEEEVHVTSKRSIRTSARKATAPVTNGRATRTTRSAKVT